MAVWRIRGFITPLGSAILPGRSLSSTLRDQALSRLQSMIISGVTINSRSSNYVPENHEWHFEAEIDADPGWAAFKSAMLSLIQGASVRGSLYLENPDDNSIWAEASFNNGNAQFKLYERPPRIVTIDNETF